MSEKSQYPRPVGLDAMATIVPLALRFVKVLAGVPKKNTPPSRVTIQYPVPVGFAAMATTGRSIGGDIAAALPKKRGVAEREDAAVAGDEPVAAAARCGGHADDGLVQMTVAGAAEEPRVAEREDPAVTGDEPVTEPRGCRDDGDDRSMQVDVRGVAVQPCVAEAEDAAFRGREPVAVRVGVRAMPTIGCLSFFLPTPPRARASPKWNTPPLRMTS